MADVGVRGDDPPQSSRRQGRIAPSEISQRDFNPPEPINIVDVQPLGIGLFLLGLAPQSATVYNLWRGISFLLVLSCPVVLGVFTFRDSHLPKATTGGIALISLTTVTAWGGMLRFFRSGHLSDMLSLQLQLNSKSRMMLVGLVRAYTVLASMFAVTVTVLWLVVSWYAMKSQWGSPDTMNFLIAYTVLMPFGIFSFVTAASATALICNIHRIQLNTFQDKLTARGYSLEHAILTHASIRQAIDKSSSLLNLWLVPVLLIFPLSILFQLFGYFATNQPDDFNGIYYIILFLFVLLVITFSGASVTSKCNHVKKTAASMYALNFYARSELDTFSLYLLHSSAEFDVLGAAITPAAASLLLYLFFTLVGVMIYKIIFS